VPTFGFVFIGFPLLGYEETLNNLHYKKKTKETTLVLKSLVK